MAPFALLTCGLIHVFELIWLTWWLRLAWVEAQWEFNCYCRFPVALRGHVIEKPDVGDWLLYISCVGRLLSFLAVQRQHCTNFRILRAQDICTVLALGCQKKSALPALEVYKNQFPLMQQKRHLIDMLQTRPHLACWQDTRPAASAGGQECPRCLEAVVWLGVLGIWVMSSQ